MNGPRANAHASVHVSDTVATRLAGEHGVWLATTLRAGASHLVPVRFVFDRFEAT